MANLRLIKQFINIFDTRRVDELHDILTVDFYFKSPQIEIFGKAEYIHYVRISDSVFTTDSVSLVAQENDLYIHEYMVNMYDSKVKLSDQVLVKEHVQIRDGLIASSIIEYRPQTLSQAAQKLLLDTVNNHFISLKKP